MRIAIEARTLNGLTGGSVRTLQQVRWLVAAGHAVDVIGERLDAARIRAAGGRPLATWRLPFARAAARHHFARRFEALTGAQRYNLVIGNMGALRQDVLFVRNLVRREWQLLAGPGQESQPPAAVAFSDQLFTHGRFERCIANSGLTRAGLGEMYGIDPARIEVLHPGYDTAQFRPEDRPAWRAAIRAELGVGERFLVAFITSGHFELRGADILLDTLCQLPESLRAQLAVLAVGRRANCDALRARFAAAGLAPLLVTRDKTPAIERYYHAADLLFHPARLEAFGFVVQEAVACGTPVLTSRCVGAAELLPVSPATDLGQPAAGPFAVRLAQLITEPTARATIARGQLAAVGGNSWERYFERAYRCYRELVTSRGIGAPRRVLIATRALRRHSGSSQILVELARGFSGEGHAVEFVAERLSRELVRASGATARYPLGSAALQGLARSLAGRPRLVAWRQRCVATRPADLVIADGAGGRQDVVLVHNILAREVGELGAAATAGQQAAAQAQAEALGHGGFQLLVANSRLCAAELEARYGVPRARIAVIHPAVDGTRFSPAGRVAGRAAARAALGFAPGELVIAVMASGHALLQGSATVATTLAAALQALPPAARAPVRVLCVGNDRFQQQIRDHVARTGQPMALRLARRRNDVETYYYAADMLLHAARFETFGLIVAEAAASGCPVITSAAVGAAEWFEGEAATGVVSTPEPGLFTPVLARLLVDAAARERLAAAQSTAAGARTWSGYYADLTAALRQRGLWW
jgi:UDP-glucose:(heptosyl)LPS alpha-1,3-glucosyltransferase